MENDITIEEKVIPAVAEAEKMIIVNNAQYQVATDFLKRLKGLEKEVESAFDPIIEKAHQAHKAAIAQKDKYLKPLLSAEKIIKSRITSFIVAEEKARREQEEKLRKETEKEQEKLRARAEAAKAKGDEAKAEELNQRADSKVAPTLAPSTDKVAGVTFKDKWSAVIVDVNLLPREYMIPDMAKLNKLAVAMKDTMKVPGVMFKSEKIVSARGGSDGE